MATSTKHSVLLYLLAALLSFNLVQARQSQFFSKVATNAKDTAVQVSGNGIQNQPNFIQDSQTGYGLYDHGSGQLPPDSDASKTPTSFPYTAADVQPDTFRKERVSGTSLMGQGYPTTYNNDETYVTKPEGYRDDGYVNEQQGMLDGNSPTTYYNSQSYVTKPEEYRDSNNNNNNNGYVNEQQGFSGTSLMDRRSPTAYNNQGYVTNPDGYDSTSNNNNNYSYNNGVNTYNPQQQQQQEEEEEEEEGLGEEKYLGAYNNNNKNTNYYNKVNNAGYTVQQQGMSDTRFMENGKYYYDVKRDYNYKPNGYSRSNINGNSQNQDGFNP